MATFDRIEHSGTAVPTTLTADITSASTTLQIDASTGWPTGSVGPFYVTIDANTGTEEKILATSRSGTTLSGLTRGVDGSAASTHSAGAAVVHGFVAVEADEANQVARMIPGSIQGIGDSVWGTGSKQLSRVGPGVTGSVVQFDQTQPAGVKMDYIGPANVSSALWGAGLVGGVGTAGAVNLDDATIGLNASAQVSVKSASIGTTLIADNAITTAKIAAGAVGTTDLADNAVTPAKVGVIPFCRLTAASPTACPNNTGTNMVFDTELTDTDTMHAPAQGRITFNTAGIYTVSASVRLQDATGTAGKLATLSILLNDANAIVRDEKGFALTGSIGIVTLTATTTRAFIATDHINVEINQQSGSTLTPTAGNEYSPIFSAVWVGPAV